MRSSPGSVVVAAEGVVPTPVVVDTGEAARVRTGRDERQCPDDWAQLITQFRRDVIGDGSLDMTAVDSLCAALKVVELDDPAPRVDQAAGLRPGPDVDERYSLDIGGEVVIGAASAAGARHGFTVLRQMLSAAVVRGRPGQLEACRVEDGPQWAWRGLTIDVVRLFVCPADLVRMIDLAALYRLSVLHVHLTDDQGWRLEIPGLPELTDGQDHYSTQQWQELSLHAESRGITLVPEVDLPGHCGALLQAFPQLASPDGRWLDPRCPGGLELIDRICAHLCQITPGRFVHVGGDEVFGMPMDLFAQVVDRARRAVRMSGRQPIGWQESARAGLSGDDVIQYWMEVETNWPVVAAALEPGVLAAMAGSMAASGDDVLRAQEVGAALIVSPATRAYLDRPYAEPSVVPEQEEQRARLGMHAYTSSSVMSAHGWTPVGTVGASAHVGGVGAALWLESARSADDIGFLLLPRLASVAEVAWGTGGPWHEHAAALAVQPRLWEAMGWTTWFRSSLIPWVPKQIFSK